MAGTVLVIVYYFPPLGMGGVQRMAKLIKYLPESGYDVLVMTVKTVRYPAYDETLLAELPGEVRIFRSGSYDAARAAHLLRLPIGSGPVASMARRRELFWPDSKIGWKGPALRLARKIMSRHPVDVILTSSPPITGHLIGRELKRQFGLPWVADFRDIWEMRPPEKRYADPRMVQKSNALLEEIGQTADAITAVSDSVGQRVSRQAQAIMGGYDPADFVGLPAAEPEKTFTLTHMGTINDMAPMEPFFAAAQIVAARNSAFGESIRFNFIGEVDAVQIRHQAAAYGLADRIHLAGYLSHAAALGEASHAAALLISVPDGYPETLPGKIFDCLSLPAPLLASVPSRGEPDKLIASCHGGMSAGPGYHKILADKMELLFKDHLEGKRWAKNDLTGYSRPGMAARFAQLFDKVRGHG
ncbi:MAG: glycosyltransferase [candidate division Zixibacteria bacterium]|nr:glycosyltransferase [candidate division Zixibacteria bacterium]